MKEVYLWMFSSVEVIAFEMNKEALDVVCSSDIDAICQ
jgi:hypothetical protein